MKWPSKSGSFDSRALDSGASALLRALCRALCRASKAKSITALRGEFNCVATAGMAGASDRGAGWPYHRGMTNPALASPVADSVLPRIRARQLQWHPGAAGPAVVPLLDGLILDIGPGLHLISGGEGRGKTALLGLLGGRLTPTGGELDRQWRSMAWPQPLDAVHDGQLARDWLEAERAKHPRWRASSAQALLSAWALEAHLDKQLHMLSAGSRRKLGLLAAAASGADLVLLDQPFAALDGPSRRVLLSVLEEAATQHHQIWVMADYAEPAGLAPSLFASRIDLGD